jgi:hypothetical protein
MKRLLKASATLMAVIAMAGCTPVQLAMWEDHTGIQLSDSDTEIALAQPDQPILLSDGSQINADGSITKTVRSEVNAISYQQNDPEPALKAFRMVATECDDPSDPCLTNEWVDQWDWFVMLAMGRESNFCPNVRRGAKMTGVGCTLKKQGVGSDSGFGQVLMGYPNRKGWYRPTGGGTWKLHEHAGWACPNLGLCTPADVISEPYSSMRVYVWLLKRAGSGPWCFGDFRYGNVCKAAPDR